jgi:hypothetical protein
MRRSLTVLSLASLMVLASLAGGCRPSRSSAQPVDEAAQRRQAANQQLLGTWVLVSFKPHETLEPMLASLLAAQFGAMTVTFDGQKMIAQGIGVTTERRYEIRDAVFNRFKLIAWDDKGVSYETLGEFRSADEVWFDSRTPPWHGTGTLRRRR